MKSPENVAYGLVELPPGTPVRLVEARDRHALLLMAVEGGRISVGNQDIALAAETGLLTNGITVFGGISEDNSRPYVLETSAEVWAISHMSEQTVHLNFAELYD